MVHGRLALERPYFARLELPEGECLTLRCRVERLRFRSRPEAERPLARLPDGVVALAWPAFRRALEREPEGQP